MADLRCPMCGKANPDSLEECQFCGARLRPLVLPQTSNLQFPPDWDKPKPAATPPAEPAKPKPDSDWLHQLRGDAPSSASAQPFKETASLPDWLGATDDSTQQAKPGVDDWLSRLRDHDEAGSQEAEEPISEDILRSRLGELGEAPPSEPEGGLPGWLSPDSAPAESSDDWLKAFEAEPEKPKPQPGLSDFAKIAAASLPEEDDDTDDWLKSFGAEPETPKPQLGLSDFAKMAAAPAPEEEDDSDSWLQSFGATPAPAEPAEPGLPDWLKTDASEPPAGEQAFKQTASFPDWLGAPSAPAGEVKDDAADWLKSLSNVSQPAASTEPAAELPAWLDNLTSSSTPPSDQPPSALSRTATLDWLSSDAGPALSGVEGAAPAEPASTPPPAAEPESNIPDWLSKLTSSSAPPSDQPPSALSRTATLDWLSSNQPAETPEADLPRADLPDWLKPAPGATPPASAPAIAGTGHRPPQTGGALDWLGPSQPAQAPEASPTGELPDWLKAMTPPTGGQPAPSSELPEPDWIISADTQPGPQAESARPSLKKTSELKADTFSLHSPTGTDPALVGSDDWLKSLDAGEPAAPTSAESGEPDWLSSLRPPEASPPASGAPAFDADDQATIPAGAPGGDLPDWLASMRPSGLDSAPPFAADVEADKTEAISPADMPAWLAPSAATVPMPPFRARAEEGTAGEADLTRGTLPSWLQAMRPIDLNAPSVDLAPEREETAGPLAGMRGILPAESVISVPGKPGAVVTRFVVSDLEAQQAELFRSIISEETQESTAAKPRPKARFAYAFDRLLIAIVLLAAVLAPYLIGDLGLFLPPAKLPEPGEALYNEIEKLAADQPVLIAFEYEPGSTGELNPGVKAVIAHLLRRGVPVAVTSTSPAGFGVAQEVLKEAADQAGLAPEDEGKKYFNLPYIAGGASGLQQFALKLPVEATARGYANFSLIIVATSSAESAQAWIEQVQPVAKVKLAAVASAAAEPMLYPYYQGEQKQLAGLVSGLAGGLLYAAMPGGAVPVEAWSAYAYGLNAAGAILALGAFVGVVMVLLTRRETQPAKPQPKAEAPAGSATPQSELKRRSPKSKKPKAGKTAKAKKKK